MSSSATLQGLLSSRALAQEISAPGREFLMLCDSPKDVPKRNEAGIRITNPGSIKGLDVAAGESFAIDLPFYGHTVTQNSRKPHQVVTFEKWGTRGALADVNDKTVLAMAEPAEGNTFFGHAAFSPDGAMLVTTEDAYVASGKSFAGKLVLRDARDLKIIQQFSSYGMFPHECRTPDSGKTIMVVNEGRTAATPPNLSWIDLASEKLLHKVNLSFFENVDYGHCDISYDNWVCVVGAPREAYKATQASFESVSFVSPEGRAFFPLLPRDITARMTEEALSIAFLGQSGLVAVTMPQSDLLLIMDYKTQTLVEALTIPKPTGVVASLAPEDGGRGVIVSCKKPERNLLSVVPTGNADRDATLITDKFGGIGSHLTRMYI
jgi:hypothetical protein